MTDYKNLRHLQVPKIASVKNVCAYIQEYGGKVFSRTYSHYITSKTKEVGSVYYMWSFISARNSKSLKTQRKILKAHKRDTLTEMKKHLFKC